MADDKLREAALKPIATIKKPVIAAEKKTETKEAEVKEETKKTEAKAAKTLKRVKDAMKINYFEDPDFLASTLDTLSEEIEEPAPEEEAKES